MATTTGLLGLNCIQIAWCPSSETWHRLQFIDDGAGSGLQTKAGIVGTATNGG
jgi:hypothetical protein